MSVVCHLSSGDVSDWRHACTNVRTLVADGSVADEITVVVNGDAVHAVVAESPVADRVAALVDDGVRLRVCRNSLHARDVEVSALARGVETVPSGVVELATRQDAGDAYLKVP